MHDERKAAQGSVHEKHSAPRGHCFPGSLRLKRRAEYRTVFDKNKQFSNRYFRVLVHGEPNRTGSRLGIVVSRRVSKRSVERNRIKRQIRECFRTHQHNLINRDMVIIAHHACESAPNTELRNRLIKLFKQLEN